MLDTVKLRSPALDEATAEAIEQACTLRMAVGIGSGQVEYSITTGSLEGSWDDRVSIRVMRERLDRMEGTDKSEGGAVWVPCAPYVIVEGSVHKAAMGHNVYGGPLDFQTACRWLLWDIAEWRLGVQWPDGLLWEVMRADWAEVYELPSFSAVNDYLHGLTNARYPRRKAQKYAEETLMFAGKTTAIKFYHKGPEFYKNDRKRLEQFLEEDAVLELQERAHRSLRVEVAVKSRKLREDFGGVPLVGVVTREYLEGVHDREVAKLLREAKHDMETVRNHVDVNRRLHEVYDPALANRLFGVWMQFSALGEDRVKGMMARPTFYRLRKQLTEAGVSWHMANVRIVPVMTEVPEGFSPVRQDARRLTDVAQEVRDKLGGFLAVA